MECPSCRHVSREEAPKFCSECGQKIPPGARTPDSGSNSRVTSVPEGEMECGLELKEEGGPQVTSVPEGEMECGLELKEEGGSILPPGSRDGQDDPAELCSDNASWSTYKGVASEVFVDAVAGTSAELEAANHPPSKRRKEDASTVEVAELPSADPEQSKKKKKKKKRNASTSEGLDSLIPSPSVSCSLNSLRSPGLQDPALPHSPAQQGGPPSQPPGSDMTPCGGRRGSLQGHTAGGAEAATGGSPAPQDQTPGATLPEGKDHDTLDPSQGSSLCQEGAGPAASASDRGPGKKDTAQASLLPGSNGDHSETSNALQPMAPTSAAIDAAGEPAPPGKGADKEGKNKTQKSKPSPVSAPEHQQENETKDKTAVTGEKSKPKDPKKPEGSNRSDVAAVKNQKDQRNQKADAHEVKESPLSPGEGITVYFHAVISKDFKFDPEHDKMFVRGGRALGEPEWKHNVCELHCTKDLGPHGSLVEGSAVLRRDLVDKHIPYKYVVQRRKDSLEYEFIYKRQHKDHVNRCLHIRASLLSSGDWHQYDDIICRKSSSYIRKWVDHFTDQTRKDVVKGKQIAATVMMDSMFSILRTWDAINLKNFFAQFQQFYAVVRVPMVYEGEAHPWNELQYTEKEVRKDLWDYLKNQMTPFLERSEEPLPEDFPVKSKLRMGLIMLQLVERVEFSLSNSDVSMLCNLLCSNASSADEFHSDVSQILGTFQSWRACLVNLCLKGIAAKVDLWVGVLPVLHHCMDLSPRGKDSRTQPEDTWAALEGISFSEFREQRLENKPLLLLMGRNKHLLDVDEHLFCSWFSLLPLTDLVHYMENFCDYLTRFPTRVLDCLRGTFYRLQGLKEIAYRNLEDIEKTLKMLLHLLDIFHDKILQEPLVQSYLTVCLQLHTTVCTLTKDHMFYEMPALSAETVCNIITLISLVDSAKEQGNKTGTNSVGSVFQETLDNTRKWLQGVFKRSIFQSTPASPVKFTYNQEIQIWKRLVEINFPTELGWKESLLGDLEGRLKQERARSQISAFCNINWEAAGSDDSVSRCFEKCAIEAVSSACQSQISILEGLSYSDLWRFGKLVSAVITKSWPRHSGQPVDDLGEVLKHLLTWPDIKHLFRLYGTNEKILENITEDGKNLMAIADSVFTNVTGDLRRGTILVEHLELVANHVRTFLDIWELKRKNLSAQEEKNDLKKVLEYRLEELTFLKKQKKYVDSLLKLCEGVKHLIEVDFGEITERHLEDLGSKRLNEAVTTRLSATLSDLKWTTHYNLSPEVQEMAKNMDLLKDSHIFRSFWTEAAGSLRKPEEEEEGEGERERQILELQDAYGYLYLPCFHKFSDLYENLKLGEVTFAEVDSIFKVFENKYDSLTADLQVMCALDSRHPKDWIKERVGQIQEYHLLHQAVRAAEVILEVKKNLGLTGDFHVLHTLLRFTDNFEKFRGEKLNQINQQLICARKLLQDMDETRYQCLRELSLRSDFISWVREALGGTNELAVFVDLASISAGENDIDVDRVACFHDAVQGYTSLLYKLHKSAGFPEFMNHLKELWKALENDPHLPSKLRDSARNLEWLKTVKESHGSVELSSLSLATAINKRGVYVIQAPVDGQISPDTVVRLILPESHGGHEDERNYSLEELKELLNKLMLMSGKKDHNSVEVEVFSEVFCNVQRLVQSFINLHSAGNMLFRTWTANVYCSPQKGVSIRMDFGLGLLSQLTDSMPVAQLLEALCRQMEDFLDQWQEFVAEKRAQHFYLNYYTAEQLVYLSSRLGSQLPSDGALTMLSFIKRNCTLQDVVQACRRPFGRAAGYKERTVMEELPLMLFCESSLLDKLKVIMKQSMVCMSAFLPECLDLDALGHCLANLARAAGPPVTRELPKGLKVGQPNLVLCGSSEVLPAALAIYLQSAAQPLPTYDEVLLCTPGTTFEEVALLLRRCLTPGSQGHRLYSLLYADQLSYEVACRAEALFRSLCMQRHCEKYQLVMVCDCEREHCYLPSAFSQHKVPFTPQAPLEAVQAYLAHHFQVPKQTPSAAAVFRDRMCVGIVASARAGVGKSLYVKRLHETLQRKVPGKKVPLKIIRLIDPQVDENQILVSLLPFLGATYQATPMIFHFDVTSSVKTGVWVFLFKLLILQYLMDVNGKMWLRNPCHLYVIEILQRDSLLPKRASKQRTSAPQFSFLDIFPKVTCRPPKQVMDMLLNPQENCREPGMDEREFCSETFQRPFQYLKRFFARQNLDTFQYQGQVEGTPGECLQHLLIYCGVINPSWSELWNFAQFLNYQLRDCEASLFCNPRIVGDTLRGFKNFVVTFMILMARDFATPTLHTSDQSPGKHLVTMDGVKEEDIAPFSLRKRWESEPHPYVFFNGDHTSMTFIGFHLQPNENGSVDAVDHLSRQVIKRDVMTMELYQGLLLQRVPFNVDFDQLPRHEKLERLCLTLGVQWAIDPDETYELTTDNMLKILAIEMRFRCGIPVIIMGETGCGKTRLIKFLSDLRRSGVNTETMRLVKVHGGTTADTIYSKVREAEALAISNKNECHLDTVLFFDEANTTEAISCIKEVLCDRTVGGHRLAEDSGLHIIAACNPYRKHSQKMISRLEAAGLGYRVSAEDTADRLGSIPLRQLVYRVHALPPSLIPLVWDFGQLNDAAEKLYIGQIVQRLVDTSSIDPHETSVISEVLSASQGFMRKTENECSFVSLRDVERCVKVFRWFYDHSEMLLSELYSFLRKSSISKNNFERDPVLWSLVLAVGVCYHASLESQESYRKAICRFLPEPYNNSKVVLDEITLTQDLFLSGVPLRKTIARNLALKENVFMMVICIELKIPLFLVGKPGSSKSLAKTIVADAMQGQAAHSDLFRTLKQVHLVSFQCSPHSTPQGIIGTFKQCARFQQGKDLQQYVSVVVLDEVGLAEDSPKMPLKTLHPLLEDGCIEDDPAPHKKVGFIGISNWALDPAKMNRGIAVSRGSPNKKELVDSAKGICSSEPLIQDRIQGYFKPFAKAYETVCKNQDKEFFGLRDYYSLIKMLLATAKASKKKPSPQDIAQAILRNFSGKDGIDALDIFAASLPEVRLSEEVSTMQLIRQNVFDDRRKGPGRELDDSECRYLLVLTRNYVALQILQKTLFGDGQQPEIIFGSSFPRDQEYTQICRNINRVKICMETGKMVVLLNLQNLYESLYDALNQYYVYLGGQKYVDLGLGTHRVKCRVHPDFRLVVIEEKDVVYKHFPIPLINRLEKHYLDINTVLETWQKNIVEELKVWVHKFIDMKVERFAAIHKYSPCDAFIGYHADTCASVVLQVTERLSPGCLTDDVYQRVLEEAKRTLLGCATPDAVVRLSASSLSLFEAHSLSQEYYDRQQHDSFADFLQNHLRTTGLERRAVFTEITTFSRLLTSHDCEMLAVEIKGEAPKPTILSLQQFDTEYSFLREVRNCLTSTATHKILIVQTDFEDEVRSAQLIASAKYSAINEINKIQANTDCIFIYFITKLSRMESGTSYVGFHGGLWQSVHIDDLRRSTVMVSDVTKLQEVTISQLFHPDDTPESERTRGAHGSHEEVMETETEEPGEAPEVDMETDCSEAMESEASELCRSHTRILDTSSLLRSCVQSAVRMLRDQHERGQRSVRRVELLLGLLSDEDERAAAFLQAAKMRLHDLLKKQEDSYLFNVKQWVVREASNPDALQEAGTFRHTLWKRVQGAVTPLLASLVSVIDRDGNLELLTMPDSPPWVRDLWMFIFCDMKLLNVPLMENTARSKSEMSYILVHHHMDLPENVYNKVPFSWRIRDYLEELWVQAQYITNAEGLSCRLVGIFQQTPLGRFLAKLGVEQQRELLQCYMKDFLVMTMKVSPGIELEFLQMALWSCINQLKAGSPEEESSLPWVHLAFQHFGVRLQNFSRIFTIYPPILDSLTAAVTDLAGCEMNLDVFAAMACAEQLTRDLLKPSPQAWLQMVKNLSMPLELLWSDGYLPAHADRTRAIAREVRAHWNRIFSIALFVEHVLLGTKSQMPELCELVTEYVFLLDKCLQENSDLKTYRPFDAVMTTLRKCKEKASKTFTRYGVQPCPICLEDAQDPVSLPCDHVFCLGCVRIWLTVGQMRCPLCLTDLPDSFCLKVSQENRNAIEKHARFRKMCTSFFVDLVSTMCFKDSSPPQKDVVEALLALLFIKKRLLDPSQKCREHTKSLSPFSDDVVDKNPVIRSVVLKLLLKYSFHEVKDYIQAYLSQLEKKTFMTEDKTELYILFSSCLEDSIHEKNSAFSTSDELKYLRDEGHFLSTYSSGRHGHPAPNEASVEYLRDTARIRLCLDRASDFLSELQGGSEMAQEKQHYLQRVEHFCTQVKNDWYRVYLMRKLTSQCGMEFVQSLTQQGHPAQWVFPPQVLALQRDHPSQMDRYLVHGPEYKALREAVGKAILEGKPQAIMTALEACRSSTTQQAVHFLLALYREVATLYRSHNANLHPTPEQREAVNKFIEESKILSPDLRRFATSLVTNTLPLLRTGPGGSSLEGTVTEMAVHTAAVLLCGQSQLLEPLKNLAFFPANMANAFLPTMPEDLLSQARNWTGLGGFRWYTCPNGHPCVVGECGMPMEQSSCVDCGVRIGGLNHRPEEGFTQVQNNTDRTQTGHVLGKPPPRGDAVVSDRGLSPVAFLLIRLLTHLAMLLGATQSPQALLGIIKPRVTEPREFLQQHIQRDLEQLMQTLGKSADDTGSTVHHILCRLLQEQRHLSDQRTPNLVINLSTKENRNCWEKLVERIILPELEDLDKTLLTVNALISRDERISSNPVAKVVLGDPAAFLPQLPQNSVVHSSKMWSCRQRISVEYLRHVVEQKNGREAVPVLWKFLQKEAELRLVSFLPELLALQKTLVKRFQNVSETEYRSIRGFISSHTSDGLKQLFLNRITVFLTTWNKLRRSLATNGEIKLPKEYCSIDLDLDADFEVILPRRRGLGLCSTALVSYLINLHNEMVCTVEKFSKENNSFSVDASEVAELHVISYEVERDLTPLILSNCQYKVEQGGKSLQECDLEKIQRQLTSRFLQGKPRITLKGLPTLVYRRDWNYEHLLKDVRDKTPQSPLPNTAINAISGQLQSYSDACEALSLIEVTVGFLSTAGENPNMDLNVYIQDVLRMGDQTEQVLKALHRCQLRHAVALWQLLSAHKSEQLLRLRKEPFGEISVKYRVDLSPEHAKLLSTFLNQVSLDPFLLELHEMMTLKLRNPQTEEDFNPNWSLRDTLVSYMETKENDILPEMESQFPEEILLASCVPVWKMAAALKRDRQTR
ncbi:hypothetical protein mRhiFer1_000154 [Rhinolophus ferrumequinum]|uniref:E3 ubiquitin-protein ligase RNF213 n=1 Tax=Rhinolophus ferrumequinum TaxID=59479 RepID=A0A7J7TAZ4_RHIFE|nr:hypothetical protein mRhiFer1_000154 [Rhinolophus ferrumequinum]